MLSDEELRDEALARFTVDAPAKFNKGTKEHNPDGTKGLMKMSPSQLVDSIAEEVIDQWHYVEALRRQIDELTIENKKLRYLLKLR
jgi:hypothetical protein|tara:strand:- start:282 stop:539 length:258 start_codon:yes stop_codon:yes gene_type:complete